MVTKHMGVEKNPTEVGTTWHSCATVQKSQQDHCYNRKVQTTSMFHWRLCAVAAVNFCPSYQDCDIYKLFEHSGWSAG